MDILVRFEDGTTEERPECGFVHHWDVERLRRSGVDFTPGEYKSALKSRQMVADVRGRRVAVWRITGQSAETKAITGEWQRCYVETTDEQIERLTRERDAAHNRYVLRDAWALLWKGWAREFWRDGRTTTAVLESLRNAAREAVDREMGNGHRYPENVKTSTLIAHLRTMDFGDSEKARADAAEKRLADLRAWADALANGQSDSPNGLRVAGDFRAVVYRIDGEEGQ